MNISHIAFDLDDTLLDTSGLIVPPALRESFEVFKKHGISIDFDDYQKLHEQFMRQSPHDDFFLHIAEKFSLRCGLEARETFYGGEVPVDLAPFSEVPEMLIQLKDYYELHLVTMGKLQRQNRKIELLKIKEFFEKIWVVNHKEGMSKTQAFTGILEESGARPESLLCVGNRVDHEIAEANRLGCRTCLVHHGEYYHQSMNGKHETPDFELNHIRELIEVCKLV